MAPLRCAAKFDPFLSLDCARMEGMAAQSKERKGSNFATQLCGAIVQKPEGPNTYNLKIWLSPSGNHGEATRRAGVRLLQLVILGEERRTEDGPVGLEVEHLKK